MSKFLQHLSTRIVLAFIMVIILIAGGILFYWFFVIVPIIRAGEQTKADQLITPYAQLMEAAVASGNRDRVEKIMNQLILLTDPEADQPMILCLEVKIVNGEEIVKQSKSPNARLTPFTTETPLFSPATHELLGTVRLYYNGDFYNRLIADAREKLFWGLITVLLLLLVVYFLLAYLLRPLSKLASNVGVIDFSKIRFLPPLQGNVSMEIRQVDTAINDLLQRLVETRRQEAEQRQLRYEAEVKYLRHEAELKHMESLKAAKEYTENIIDTVPSLLIIVNNQFNILSANKAFEALRRQFPSITPEQFVIPLENEIKSKIKTGESMHESIHKEIVLTPEGSEITMTFSAVVSQIKIGAEEAGILLTITDITHRKEAEDQIKKSLEEKEVLLREIHHRVKNNMQVISSLLSLQFKYIKNRQYIEMLKESQNRIRSMALIHEKLYTSRDLAKIDFCDYIKNLTNDLLTCYGVDAGKIALKIDIQDVLLGVDSAIPCGLILNEIVSNSLKHAFPDGREGEIKIALRPIEENEMELIVSDNGIGIPKDLDFRNTESLGLQLITTLAEDQIHGKIELNRAEGTEFHIRFKEIKYKQRI